jgi:predicted translin family RNA/ssDNA-binding protein
MKSIETEAQEIVEKFMFADIYFTDGKDGAKKNAIACAKIYVEGIIEVLKSIRKLEYTGFQLGENEVDSLLFQIVPFRSYSYCLVSDFR